MAVCWYLLEANIYLSVAYLFYTLLLKRYTFFQQHRYYLLAASVFSFIIPLISWSNNTAGPVTTIKDTVGPAFSEMHDVPLLTDHPSSVLPLWNAGDILLSLVCVVAIVNVLRLIYGIIKIVSLYRRSEKTMQDGVMIAMLTEQKTVFSFFSWIFSHGSFLHDRLIREHELLHARQRHSADIMWYELIKAINWFNPFAYLLLKSAKINHEFIVDAKLAETNEPYDYAMMLITHAHSHSSKLTHAAFASSQIETRLNRMVAGKSSRSSRNMLLLLFPVLLPMICFSIFKLGKSYALLTIRNADQSLSTSYQESMVKNPVSKEEILTGAKVERIGDTLPRRKIASRQLAKVSTGVKQEARVKKDTLFNKPRQLESALLYPSSENGQGKEAEGLHDIENRSSTVEKESVYGKYASLGNADSLTDYNRSLRRTVSVFPESRYGDKSVSTGRFTGPVSIFDSTKYKSAFQ